MNLKDISKRFKEKVINVMRSEIQEYSFQTWIKPLKVIRYKNNTLWLYHDIDSAWVLKHYGARIKELLNEGVDKDKEIGVIITSKKGSE